jgi:hypothetical protein
MDNFQISFEKPGLLTTDVLAPLLNAVYKRLCKLELFTTPNLTVTQQGALGQAYNFTLDDALLADVVQQVLQNVNKSLDQGSGSMNNLTNGASGNPNGGTGGMVGDAGSASSDIAALQSEVAGLQAQLAALAALSGNASGSNVSNTCAVYFDGATYTGVADTASTFVSISCNASCPPGIYTLNIGLVTSSPAGTGTYGINFTVSAGTGGAPNTVNPAPIDFVSWNIASELTAGGATASFSMTNVVSISTGLAVGSVTGHGTVTRNDVNIGSSTPVAKTCSTVILVNFTA